MSWVTWPGESMGNTHVAWTDDAGRLEKRLLRGKWSQQYVCAATPFISFGELCLIVTYACGDNPAIIRLSGRIDSFIPMYLTGDGMKPHVSRLPDGDEIVVHTNTHIQPCSRVATFQVVLFRICSKDKTYTCITRFHTDAWSGYGVDYPIAYLPNMGKLVTLQQASDKFAMFSDIIVAIVPTFVNGGGDIQARVERIYDTNGDHVLIRIRPEDDGHKSEIGFIADYNLSSSSLTILDTIIGPGSRYNARYAAENIAVSICIATICPEKLGIIRKAYNLIDGSSYMLTDEIT